MKIQFIGTGSIGAKERSACTLINDEILIDLGNGNIKAIKQLGNDILKIKALFITHLHGDHYADIPFFILDRCFLKDKIKEELVIYGPKKIEEQTKIIHEAFFGEFENDKSNAQVRFEEINESETKKVKHYSVVPYAVEHGKLKPAYGYIVSQNGKSIGFSGDSVYCEAIEKIVENSDVSVLDMSAPKNLPAHMGMEDIIKICEKYPNKKIMVTHMHDETRREAQKLKINNLIIPKDGYIFEI